MKFSSRLIHIGSDPDPQTGAIMPPIYMTSTFVQEAPASHKGFDYTRAGNPNFTKLEELLASLEEAQYATIFSSGLGAITSVLSMLSCKDSVVVVEGVYGGTYRLLSQVFTKFGIHIHFTTVQELPNALQNRPKFVFFETPTNPLLEVIDIKLVSELAKQVGALTIVDNTLATPYFQNPLKVGADIVIHSTTKYLGGHSDIIGGAVVTSRAEIKEAADFYRKALGTNPSPFDAWLSMRGVKTLAVRMQAHQKNAQTIFAYLSKHRKVKKVFYPGFSGIISAEFDLPESEIHELLCRLKLFSLAESLGGIESLVCQPATMTHASIPEERRVKMNISNQLLRFSVGLEDPSDLVEDLNKALGP